MSRIALVALLFSFSVTIPSDAQERSVDAGYRGSRYSFRVYRPVTIRRLNELPSPVLSKLEAHLKERLGAKFYARLRFDWGDSINLDDLYRTEPYWKTEKVGAYDLVFHFSDESKGLKAFYSKLLLDANGVVMDEINLPDVANAPLKAKLIPAKQALKIAAQDNVEGRQIWPTFDYYRETDSFVWIIEDSEPVTKKGVCPSEDPLVSLIQIGNGPYRRVFIEAHTGRILKRDCHSFAV